MTRLFKATAVTATLCFLLAGCAGSSEVVTDEPVAIDVVEPAMAVADDNSEFPLDPLVTTGELANGLKYYIRENNYPENRAELRLIVNAGSILEDDDQQGLAHFLEHMAFNGTEKYAKQELIDYLELTGTRFGADLNAYTSFDETVYQLQVRTDSGEVFDKGLEILREWAGAITLDPEEMDKERGVVIEEWRLGRGAQARLLDKQLPVLLYGSKYAERLPIGKKEVLETFEYGRVRDFYDAWYRPDLMAVVVVGPIDMLQVESQIAELFGTLETPDSPANRENFAVPDHDETLVTIEFDSEAPYGAIGISTKSDKAQLPDDLRFRTGIVESLVARMFDSRYEELLQQSEPPFIAAYANVSSWVRTKKFYDLDAYPQGGDYQTAFRALLTEAERVKRFGFTSGELERQKLDVLRGFEAAYNERDKTESSSYAQELAGHFLEADLAPGIEFEYNVIQDLLPEISLEEVNEAASKWLGQENRVLVMSGAEKTDGVPGKDQLLSIMQEVAGSELEPYVDTVDDGPLVENLPSPGEIVDESMEPVGITRLVLSNGVDVALMPTDFQDDEIQMFAYSPGGASLAPDEQDISADFAINVVTAGGVGRFNSVGLQKKLAGKLVQISPYLTENSEGFSGSSTPQDVETLLQLVHLYGTAPRRDEEAYASYVQRIGSLVESYQASPDNAYNDTLGVVFANYHPRRRAIVPETLAELDLDEAFEIYKDRFADFGDFDFYFVGSFDIDEMKPLLQKYLGSLPSGGREESWRDMGIRPPSGVVEKTVVAGVEPQAQVRVLFSGPAQWSLDEERRISTAGGILEIRLREALREELGGTYGAFVSSNIDRVPYQQYEVVVGFGCAPDRVDEMVARLFAEMESMTITPVDDEYLQKVKETRLNGFEQNLRKNGYWVNNIAFFDRSGLDVNTLPTGLRDFYSRTDVEDVREAAAKYYNLSNYVKVVLMPEE